MDMSRFKKYSSTEVYEVAEMAKAKGLVLLEGEYHKYSSCSDNTTDFKGYCLAKEMANQYFTLKNDDTVYQDYEYDGCGRWRAVYFNLTLEQAKERITNFSGAIKEYPDFYAFVRIFDGEPAYCGQVQMLYLEEFARRHGITYKEKFVCVGGQREDSLVFPADGPEMYAGIYDTLRPSWFSFLVVADIGRLSDYMRLWENKFEIIYLNMKDFGYTEYWYRESETPRKKVETCYTRTVKDMEYEIMEQEHRLMMIEQDEPFIEAEEEHEE